MKFLFHVLIVCVFSCSERKRESEFTEFSNDLYTLNYPNSWIKRESSDVNLAISKYSDTQALIEEFNPNFIIKESSAEEHFSYGFKNLEEYTLGFFNNQINKDEITSYYETKKLIINNIKMYNFGLIVQGKHQKMNQHFYFFEHSEKHICLILTNLFDKQNNELTKILNSIEIKW